MAKNRLARKRVSRETAGARRRLRRIRRHARGGSSSKEVSARPSRQTRRIRRAEDAPRTHVGRASRRAMLLPDEPSGSRRRYVISWPCALERVPSRTARNVRRFGPGKWHGVPPDSTRADSAGRGRSRPHYIVRAPPAATRAPSTAIDRDPRDETGADAFRATCGALEGTAATGLGSFGKFW
jgi:hypothetical protein